MRRGAGLLAITVTALALGWQQPSAAARVGDPDLGAAPLDAPASWRADAGETSTAITQRHRDRRDHRDRRARRVRERHYQPPPPPPPPPSCRATLLELGHSPTALMFCDGVEPYCADALLRNGHSPTSLMFCQGVDPQCAVSLLYAGRSPTELMHCD